MNKQRIIKRYQLKDQGHMFNLFFLFILFFSTSEKQYTTYDEIFEALLRGDVNGALIDTYVLGSRKDLFEKPSFRIIKIYDYSTAYGVVLGGEAKKLKQCFKKYMQGHQETIFQTIQKHVEFVEVRCDKIVLHSFQDAFVCFSLVLLSYLVIILASKLKT